jgi:prophage antirepressor-like protein
MGFLKNVAKRTTRVVTSEAKKSIRKTGNKLFGSTYTKAAKKRRTADRRAR